MHSFITITITMTVVMRLKMTMMMMMTKTDNQRLNNVIMEIIRSRSRATVNDYDNDDVHDDDYLRWIGEEEDGDANDDDDDISCCCCR